MRPHVKLNSRLRAVEQAVDRIWNREEVAAVSVCDRIEELTGLFAEHPPQFPPAVEAGIMAAIDREERALATIEIS